MNFEELQDDIDRYEKDHFISKPRYVVRIVEAARLVADPNIDKAFWVARKALGNLGTRQLVKQIVAAALTPGDTNG